MDTKTLCLGILTHGKASGYDIRKQLEEVFSNFMEVSASGVYPALKALEQRGHVSLERVFQDGRPNKKVYTITESGRRAFVESLAASSGRHKVRSEMLALMFFAEHVPTAHLSKVLTGRLKLLETWTELTSGWLAGDESEEGTPGQNFISRYALAVMKAEIAFLRHELPMLSQTLSRQAQDVTPIVVVD